MSRRFVRILLVDDDEDSFLITKHLLSTSEHWECQIDWAGSYDRGLELIRRQQHDICLIDYRLDSQTGLDLLREGVQAGVKAPMIMLTGLGDREVDLQAMRAGAADYLSKDNLDGELLERSIRYALEHRRLNEALEERAARLRALAGQLNRAEQRERTRIARLLHDHLQQILVAAKMRLDKLTPEGLEAQLPKVRQLLDEVLQVSRTLAVELNPPILLDAGLAAALEWLSRWMRERYHLRVDAKIDEEAEPASETVRMMLFHAVRELLFNVIKHANVEEVSLEMARADGEVRIVVEDEGIGFDPEVLSQPVATPDHAGYGLVHLRERLQLVDGRLEVEAAPDQGCRVTLAASRDLFPAETTFPVSPPTPEERVPAPAEAGRPIRVLLADDHPVLREGLARTLAFHDDLDVVGEAGDGEEAVRLVQQLHPDVVVMDVVMPGTNGIEATRRILAEQPQTRVIGLSMYSDEDMAQIMQRAGASAYLSKGGPIEDLVEQIRKSVTAQPSESR